MIVKVQQSLATNAPVKQMLIYNEDRTIFYEDELVPVVAAALAGRPKAYFEAKHNLETGMIELYKEVEAQNW